MANLNFNADMSRRKFLAALGIGSIGVISLLAGCSSANSRSSEDDSSASQDVSDAPADQASGNSANAAVVYFSRADENYEVGVIEVGNTAIVAQAIAQELGVEAQEIVPENAYPTSYSKCTDVAKEEQNRGDRPALANTPDISGNDTIYLGYPIWWSDLPMCVFTYLESQDWNGKTIVPFCTHAGSEFGVTESSIASACAGAHVREGLSLRGTVAQDDRDEVAKQAKALVESVG